MKITRTALYIADDKKKKSHLLHRLLLHFISMQSIKHKRDREEKTTEWEH